MSNKTTVMLDRTKFEDDSQVDEMAENAKHATDF